MVKVNSDDHIWGLEMNRYVCFTFLGNRTIFGWDISKSISDLDFQGQGHDKNRPKSKQVIYTSEPSILPVMNEIQKFIQRLLREKHLWPVAAAYEPVQKHSVTPAIPGWLN